MMEAMELGVKVLAYAMGFGLVMSVFLVLATSAIIAVVHTIKRVIS